MYFPEDLDLCRRDIIIIFIDAYLFLTHYWKVFHAVLSYFVLIDNDSTQFLVTIGFILNES